MDVCIQILIHRVSHVHIRQMDMAFFSLKLIYFLLTFLIFNATRNCSALSIKLIHRHSVESPYYPGNITRTERINLLAHSSSSSSLRFSKQTKNTTSIRPRLDSQNVVYMIEVGIGTFHPPHPRNYNYFLHLDTSNDLTWTQCDKCLKMDRGYCFQQKPPLFPSNHSSTYTTLLCDKDICKPEKCLGSKCGYKITYGDGAMTLGYMAREAFTFASSDGENKIQVKDIVFGCGIRNTGFAESAEDNLLAGNFGLGKGVISFLRQKMSLTKGRFSYCFMPWDVAHKSPVFLRFGSDIPKRKDLKSTPLLTKPGRSDHFVNLTGISVGNTRLDIPQKMLGQSGKLNSGCIVDSGSYMTRLPKAVYNKLTETLMTNHFSGNEPTQIGHFGFCYFFPSGKGIKKLPNITFHLQDSDLVFPPRQGFIDLDAGNGDSFFCLAMMPDDDIEGVRATIIGGFQQANMRFVFDTVKQKLYFGPEDCSRDV